ncbi:hypothetical protein ACJX0J_017090, partial [Zea mays]
NDHFKIHVAHADEKKETPVIVDEKKLSTFTMDGDVCQMKEEAGSEVPKPIQLCFIKKNFIHCILSSVHIY